MSEKENLNRDNYPVPYTTVADPGGGRIGRGPPFFRPIFVFLAYFGRFSGAESRNLDSRPPPPLFTDPGSATVPCLIGATLCYGILQIVYIGSAQKLWLKHWLL